MRILIDPDTGKTDVEKIRYLDNFNAFQNQWVLTVKVEVADGNKPEQVNQARTKLQKVCTDWGEYLEFDFLDPAAMDPKVRWT